ncbi:MAG: hypothetical protein K2Y51_15985 [Gammaproteobacteria bacterium]|nr:hypothetical protein [Gammaproteobacteria bacterium]
MSHGCFVNVNVISENERARTVLQAGVERLPSFGTLWLNYAVVREALGHPQTAQARRKAESLMTPAQRAHPVR